MESHGGIIVTGGTEEFGEKPVPLPSLRNREAVVVLITYINVL
jgi:hypothetical protein